MAAPPDDRTLVDAARHGDRKALDALLRRHYDRVFAVCRRVTGNEADAADAAQEALLAIVRGLPHFDGRSALSTWIYRIATNASLDELRRRKRRPTPTDRAGTDRAAADVSEGERPGDRPDLEAASRIDAIAERSQIDAALQSLSLDFRTALVLRDVADLDYAEIADALDIPIGTVKSRIARARSALCAVIRADEAAAGNQAEPVERPTSAS